MIQPKDEFTGSCGRQTRPSNKENRMRAVFGTAAVALMVVMLAHMALRTSIALPDIIERSEARAAW
ncbi:hypothetical protein SAMN04488094_1057 [Tropicimonas isoalkanivorans]|uniref:Uncharacterized protein n=1 Tax=Tropicimonas isoalkanivorans TaxID=441112 RepID=A0A1I1J7F8_9RHOB|nr:hypothetical protein SAMN04488094_1057 [Tropicimonas isoalkanivorans]